MRTYKVELTVAGDITIIRDITFNTEKELSWGDVFSSDITIKNHSVGLKLTATVHTEGRDNAYKVALLFIGKMLDVLTMKINTGLLITTHSFNNSNKGDQVKAVVERDEFEFCFEGSRRINLNHPALLRAFNWYRKGLYTDDPFDRFLAFWNSICVVAGKYHTRNDRTALGIINQIWDCFITLWGGIEAWPLIAGDDKWVDENNGIRNNIAHGLVPVEIHYVEKVLSRLNLVQQVAYEFLISWANRQLYYNIRG